jgi:DNA-binding MarR family transcriptional regulator
MAQGSHAVDDSAERVLELAAAMRAMLDEVSERVGLTPTQAQALVAIGRGRRMGDLATDRVCDPSTVTALVARLEREGLVARVADVSDARVRVVVPTPRGRRLVSRFRRQLAREAEQVAAARTPLGRAISAAGCD